MAIRFIGVSILLLVSSCRNKYEKIDNNNVGDIFQMKKYRDKTFCIILDGEEGLYFINQYDSKKNLIASSRVKNSETIPVIDSIDGKYIIIRYDNFFEISESESAKIKYDTLRNDSTYWPKHFKYNGDFEIIYKYTSNKGKIYNGNKLR